MLQSGQGGNSLVELFLRAKQAGVRFRVRVRIRVMARVKVRVRFRLRVRVRVRVRVRISTRKAGVDPTPGDLAPRHARRGLRP